MKLIRITLEISRKTNSENSRIERYSTHRTLFQKENLLLTKEKRKNSIISKENSNLIFKEKKTNNKFSCFISSYKIFNHKNQYT